MDGYSQRLVKTPGVFIETLFILAFFALSGCSFNPHDDVYSLVSAKSRTLASVAISPGNGSEYAFTIDKQPSIEITSPIDGATAYYSIDGGAYERYAEAFALPIKDPKVDQSFTVTAYVTHPEYNDSVPVSQTYRFVATTVPTPTILVTPESSCYHFYYHYDSAPQISASCSLAQATIWYSLDGGVTYAKYTGPFSLPLPADQTKINTVTVTMYASLTGYIDSATATMSYRFAPNGTIVTIAGKGGIADFQDGDVGAALFNQPYGLYVDAKKNIYVADFGNSRIRMIAPNGTVSTVAGDGQARFYGNGIAAVEASLNLPMGIAMDEAHNILYVADTSNFCVRAVSLGDGIITTYAGVPGTSSGPSPESHSLLSGVFRSVLGITFDAEKGLAITDTGSATVWGLQASGITRLAGVFGSANTTSAGDPLTCHFQNIHGITWDANGNLHLIDIFQHAIYVITSPGESSATIAPEPGTLSDAIYPEAITSVGDDLYFTDSNRISAVYNGTTFDLVAGSSSSGYSGDGGPATTAKLNAPAGVFVVPGDGVYISDTHNHCIRKVILY
ncbi:MAG TPA: hypothetical protein PK542_03575 [Treponemataceae bacterium]|nr:hypothetical protein [Treponemataceae bacterium]HPS43547.1 hypothetical protein [Treponemataceae bacterium]